MSERAERARRDDRSSANSRARSIDETLVRLTAAHAGLAIPRDDDEDEPLDDRPRFSIRQLPRPSLGQVVLLVLAFGLFLTSATGWVTKARLAGAVRQVAALDLGSGSIVDGVAQKGDRNVLVVATDPVTPDPAARNRTKADTVTVVHVPAGGGPVVVLSIPAGLEANRPPCSRFDPVSAGYTSEAVPVDAHARLVSALELGGPRCVTRAVQQLTGLSITGYVGVNLDRLPPMVDAVGGIPVCLARPVQDAVLGPVAPAGGRQDLDARHAGDFARAGNVTGDPSPEYGRTQRQQQVLSAVLDAALSTTGLLRLGQVSALGSAIGGGLVTDGIDIDGVSAVARSLHDLDANGVTFASTPTERELNGRGDNVLRGADADALFAAMRNHGPLPHTGAAAAGSAGPGPGDMTVQVLNASEMPGLAAQIGGTLRNLGFGIGEVANAAQPTTQTVIRFSPDQSASAALLASSVPAAASVPDPGTTRVLQLVLGRSFDGVVKPPVLAAHQDPAVAAAAPANQATCS